MLQEHIYIYICIYTMGGAIYIDNFVRYVQIQGTFCVLVFPPFQSTHPISHDCRHSISHYQKSRYTKNLCQSQYPDLQRSAYAQYASATLDPHQGDRTPCVTLNFLGSNIKRKHVALRACQPGWHKPLGRHMLINMSTSRKVEI